MVTQRVITALCGGLGNQMFQYAAGRALALRFGVPLLLDTSWYTSMGGDTPREYLLHIFSVQGQIATAAQITHMRWEKEKLYQKVIRKLLRRPCATQACFIQEPHFHYWSNFTKLKPPVFLSGYWQSEQYFSDFSDIIRKDFQFPALPEGPARKIAQAIKRSSQPVAIHIRRGDYVNNKKTNAEHGLCTENYYATAIRHIINNFPCASLFLFSDDPLWVQEHFDSQGLPAIVVDLAMPHAPWHDMHLMGLCRHQIIANSSFSWWGAWLSGEKGITCAPKNWFAAQQIQNESPCPARWIQL